MEYRCVATSVEGFVQQLAVAYITHGYWFYVTGTIPEGKDPAALDAKLINRYGIAISKWARCRRKKQGLANMQYLRYERFFVLLATKGRHKFFEAERDIVEDARRVAIRFADYSISYRNRRVSVRIAPDGYAALKGYYLKIACRRSEETLAAELARSCLLPYSPVRAQLLNLWRAVNRVRRTAGLPPVPIEVVTRKRRIARPFGLKPSAGGDSHVTVHEAPAPLADDANLPTSNTDSDTRRSGA